MPSHHKPVLLKEVLECLDPRSGDVVVDATFGFGGHSKEILDRIGPKGKLIAIDQDPEVIEKSKLELQDERITYICDNFRNLTAILENLKTKKIDKILFDLGISSYHFDSARRGFSFKDDEPLDMRLSGSGPSAEDLVNGLPEVELADMFFRLGDERASRVIAKAIVEARRKNRIVSTNQLVDIICSVKKKDSKHHQATKVFQALRIATNDELNAETEGIIAALDALDDGGRIAVISFHSGEDRIVKNIFKSRAKDGKLSLLNKKPIIAKIDEITDNNRARSAKLRTAIRRK